MNPHYSIIIPCYNHLDLTIQCINSIVRNSNVKSLEIILINDGSTDGTKEWSKSLERKFNLSIIDHQQRIGFTKSCLEGMKLARGDYIVLLNNDTLVTPNWLNNLENSLFEARRRYKNPNFHLVGPMSNNVSGLQQIKIDMPIDKVDDYGEKYYSLNKNKIKPVLLLSGFCLMFTRKLYNRVGGFDERFSPGGYEDSLTKDRPIIIKNSDETIEILTIEELFNQYHHKSYKRTDSKEEIELQNIKTLSFSKVEKSQKTLTEIQKYALAKKKSGYTLAQIANERKVSEKTAFDYTKPQTSSLDEYDIYGKWTNIKKIIRHKVNKMVHRINQRVGNTEVTPDHSLIYMDKNQEIKIAKPKEFLHKDLININILPEIKEINKIDLLDYLNSPEIEYDSEYLWLKLKAPNHTAREYLKSKQIKILRKLEGDKLIAFLKLLAAYISEGSYTEWFNEYNQAKQVHISSTDLKWLKSRKQELNLLFRNNKNNIFLANPISSGEYYHKKKVFRLIFPSYLSGVIFKELCGKHSFSKKIPNFVFNLGNDYIRILLEVLKQGDGLILTKKAFPRSTKSYRQNHFKYFTSSEQLIAGLSFLLTKLNKKFTINTKFPTGSSTSKHLTFYIEECNRHSTRENRRKKTWRKYNDYVYDLALEDSHIFADACGLILVHNTDFCLRARLEGFLACISQDTFIYHHGHSTIKEFPELDRGHINRWKYFEKWKDDKAKKLVAMYYVQDTRYLKQSLESINEAVDEIVILDSSHQAKSITDNFPKVVICQDAKLAEKQPIPKLLSLAKSREPDWLLLISDRDQIEQKFTREYAEELMHPIIPDIMGYEFSEFTGFLDLYSPQRLPKIFMQRNLPGNFPTTEDSITNLPLRILHFAWGAIGNMFPWPKENSIALVTIMKNEAKDLDSFLEHTYLAFNEIILLDTGSTDNSKEIAKKWGARVYDFKWKNHYGVARNVAMNFANTEWILQVDIDEKIEEITKVYEMINSGKDAFLFTIVDLRPGGGVAFPESIRLFRNLKEVSYSGIVHETVTESLFRIKNIQVDRATTKIIHYGRLKPDAEEKKKYYRELAMEQLRKDENNPLPYFHLALLERDNKHIEEALDYMQKAATRGWNKPNIRLEFANTHLLAAKVLYDTLKDIDPGHPYYNEIMKKIEILGSLIKS